MKRREKGNPRLALSGIQDSTPSSMWGAGMGACHEHQTPALTCAMGGGAAH